MKVLLTGASGRLGSATFKQLLDAGYDVTATDMSRKPALPGRVRVGDLLNREFCYDVVDGVDAIVHLANHPSAQGNAQRVFNENVAMTMNVLQAAIDSGVKKIVYSSSIQAMTGLRNPQRMNEPCRVDYLPMDGRISQNPGNTYGLSKCVGEQQLQYAVNCHHLTSAIAIRFPLLMMKEWYSEIKSHQTKPAVVPHWMAIDEAFTWLAVNDAASLLVAILKADLPGYRCYMPAHPRPRFPLTPREIIEKYFANIPLRKQIEQIEQMVDISGITADTGWKPVENFWDA